ncbi:MAG: type 3 dihydrofolate reductase [Gammaproteobacteria bacterium]|nr:type 3 dihydrofolate reductase [Gammaproteobacteria bacterium]
MILSMIVAMGENHAIGKDGGMPWHLPADLQYFKRVTMGKPIIMGRKTFESIGRPLPGRPNLVITRSEDFAPEGVDVHSSPEAALAAVADVDEAMIIGGGRIYAELLPQADRLYVTFIHADFEADTFFPELGNEWQEVSREDHAADEKNPVATSYVVLERR